MLKSDAIAHFKSQAKIAELLGISEAAVSQWDEVVPFHSACKLERHSGRNGPKVQHWMYGAGGRRLTPAERRAFERRASV